MPINVPLYSFPHSRRSALRTTTLKVLPEEEFDKIVGASLKTRTDPLQFAPRLWRCSVRGQIRRACRSLCAAQKISPFALA